MRSEPRRVQASNSLMPIFFGNENCMMNCAYNNTGLGKYFVFYYRSTRSASFCISLRVLDGVAIE